MDIEEIVKKLSERDLRVLLALSEGPTTVEKIAQRTGYDEGPVHRSLYWLERRGLVKCGKDSETVYVLGPEGKSYAKKGLPELRILETALERGGSVELAELAREIPRDVLGPALGWAKRKGYVRIKADENGERVVEALVEEEPNDLHQRVLETLSELGEATAREVAEALGEDEETVEKALRELSGRGEILDVKDKEIVMAELTETGRKALPYAEEVLQKDWITAVTPEVLKSGEWKEKDFKPYDVKAPVAPRYPGKKHPLKEVIDEIRRIFLEMGFVEVEGPLVESSFWNFDALFQPQDHAAREMQDTFYLEEPDVARLPPDEVVDEVKAVHEDGGDTGSRGWGYDWSESVARKTVLRTHTTAVSVRKLYEEEGPPVKAFSVGRVYRRETIDYKHLPEFHQCEGIILAEDVSFRELLGVLEEFYRRMGFEEVRFRPAYFPYTVLSVEPEVYFEEKGDWVELGGAGIFRPEVLRPLGFDENVTCLAWGLGVERLTMLKLGIDDIRELYMSDLKTLLDVPSVRTRAR